MRDQATKLSRTMHMRAENINDTYELRCDKKQDCCDIARDFNQSTRVCCYNICNSPSLFDAMHTPNTLEVGCDNPLIWLIFGPIISIGFVVVFLLKRCERRTLLPQSLFWIILCISWSLALRAASPSQALI
jgi:hypothetical protein